MIVGSIFYWCTIRGRALDGSAEFGFAAEAERITWNLAGYAIATVIIYVRCSSGNSPWEIRESRNEPPDNARRD